MYFRLLIRLCSQNSVVLGGTHQSDDWNVSAYDKDRDFILGGCLKMAPAAISGAEFIGDWVGLRPGRCSVRLEKESDRIIHNYGHGGSGITLFWGCAKDVVELVRNSTLNTHV